MASTSKTSTKRVLELLRSTSESPASIGERVGASPEAVDEARCLLEEIDAGEVDAILAMPPILARALMRAASEAGRYEVLEEAALHSNKEIQKEARRIAHHLRLRGVDVTLTTGEKEAPTPSPPVESPEPPILLSTIDPEGGRRVFWTRNRPGRGVEVAELWCSDSEVRDFSLGEISRKQLRAAFADLKEKKVPLFHIERDEGLRFLNRVRVAVRDGGISPPEFSSWSIQALGPLPETPPSPIAPLGEGKAPEDPAALQRLAGESASLFSEPELLGWVPDEETLGRLSLRVSEVRQSPLFLPGEAGEKQRQEAVMAAIDRLAEEYWTEDRRKRGALWLLEVARLFELGDKLHQAQVAASAADLLSKGAPLSEVPFGYEFLRRVVSKPT